jgi:phosphopentomutase
MIKRIILIVLDSVGIGELPDAITYNDKGANTLKHIFNSMGKSFSLPNMAKLGLYKLLNIDNFLSDIKIISCYGKMMTASPAKDTTAGHWEISGIILKKPFPVYPNGFSREIIEDFEKQIDTKIIGNCVASGTEIIKRLGAEHQRTKYPIVYTSTDSVFQIATHEKIFRLERLYEICQIARNILQGDRIVGRVIARPFIGEENCYTRTINRKDYSLNPFGTSILDEIKNSGGDVIAIGKIEDIFNARGITKAIYAKENLSGMNSTLNEVLQQPYNKRTLIFTNLVDFDMLWGHRRDVVGYARELKKFDSFLPKLIEKLKDNDMLVVTADHGCDPTYKLHTNHTREYVPLLIYGKKLRKNINLGTRETLSDIAQTIADIFELPPIKNGRSFRDLIF